MTSLSGSAGFVASSRARLTDHDLERFRGDTLFDRLARQVCHAGCLPRKELFEAWETARRVRRRCRGGRVVDLGGGHGLLAQVMLLLDDSSPEALVVDTTFPASHGKVHEALTAAWPRLNRRTNFMTANLSEVQLRPTDIVVSVHACGGLTDVVLDLAAASRARVAVVPCCHNLGLSDQGGLEGWLEGTVAVDVIRATRLRAAGYQVWTQTVPASITPKNRLLIGIPAEASVRQK
jgi:hypothetical protein